MFCLDSLRTVSLFLENPWERTQNKRTSVTVSVTCERDGERGVRGSLARHANPCLLTRMRT